MIIKNYDDVINAIEHFKEDDLIIAKDAFPIKKLFIQTIKREIDGKLTSFVALKNIEIEKEYQKKGIFSKIISIMERNNQNFMVYNIVNPHLFASMSKKVDYKKYSQFFCESECVSFYKIK